MIKFVVHHLKCIYRQKNTERVTYLKVKWMEVNIRLSARSESPAASSADPEMAFPTAPLRHMEMQRSVITGALCD